MNTIVNIFQSIFSFLILHKSPINFVELEFRNCFITRTRTQNFTHLKIFIVQFFIRLIEHFFQIIDDMQRRVIFTLIIKVYHMMICVLLLKNWVDVPFVKVVFGIVERGNYNAKGNVFNRYILFFLRKFAISNWKTVILNLARVIEDFLSVIVSLNWIVLCLSWIVEDFSKFEKVLLADLDLIF